MDCENGSDEDNCTIAIVPEKYRKFLPPLGKEQKYLKVKTSVMVSDLYAINEKDLSFRMKLEIELEWFDYRITLQDLSNNTMKNNLPDKKGAVLYLPQLYFKNDLDSVRLDYLNNGQGKLQARRYKAGRPVGTDTLHEHLLYDGSDNSLVQTITVEQMFRCNFQLRWYPFDIQHCNVKVIKFSSYLKKNEIIISLNV